MELEEIIKKEGRNSTGPARMVLLSLALLLSSMNLQCGGRYKTEHKPDPQAEKADEGSKALVSVGEQETKPYDGFIWPVPEEHASWNHIVSGYGFRNLDGSKKMHFHGAIDISLTKGTPLVAIADGRIDYLCSHEESESDCKGLGTTVRIKHDGVYTLYAHMNTTVKGLEEGMIVRKGEVIGYSGNSGISRGPHLHFAVYKGGKTKRHAVNPLCLYPDSTIEQLDMGRQVRLLYGDGPLNWDNPLIARECRDVGTVVGTGSYQTQPI
jgi:murein DD-endopeptidase MepM/ murein hydrolase activator NlpD